MKPEILMVDDEADLLWSVVQQAGRERPDLHFEGTTDPEDALARIRARVPEVLVTDVRMPKMNGLELMVSARQISATLPVVVVTAFGTPDVLREVKRGSAVFYLEKPVSFTALATTIDRALAAGAGFSGAISLPMLPDLLQVYTLSRTHGALEVSHGSEHGTIWFADGDIVHAETGELEGEDAVYLLLHWRGGKFALDKGAVAPRRSILAGWQELLLEGCRRLDEEGRDAAERAEAEEVEQDSETGGEAPTSARKPHDRSQSDVSSSKEETMGKIDEACREVVSKVDGAVACGVVDLDTGMLLGIHNASQYTQTLNEIVAAATMDMFRGANTGRIEQLVRAHRGVPEDGGHYFQEVHITSAHNFHFAKTLKDGKAAMVLVTKKTTNIGMGWAQLKAVLPVIEPHVP